MDKQQEIKILQSLKGDTYFNQFFSSIDIDRMCQNITNDLVIECGCDFNQQAIVFQRQIISNNKEYKEQNESRAKAIIDALCGDIPDELYDILWEMTSKLFVIKCKREKGYELTDAEFDYLIKQAER